MRARAGTFVAITVALAACRCEPPQIPPVDDDAGQRQPDSGQPGDSGQPTPDARPRYLSHYAGPGPWSELLRVAAIDANEALYVTDGKSVFRIDAGSITTYLADAELAGTSSTSRSARTNGSIC